MAYEESVRKENELTRAAIRFEGLPPVGKLLIGSGAAGASPSAAASTPKNMRMRCS